MAKYQWGSKALKKKSKTFGWISLCFMALALLCVTVISAGVPIVFALMGVAIFFFYMSYKYQQDDKKLKQK